MAERKNVPGGFVRQIADRGTMSVTYMMFMGLSGVLAATALLANSVPLLLGAMIIAPAFAPISLIAVAAVAGRWRLVLRGTAVTVAGLAMAVALAMATTWLMNALGVLSPDENLLDRALLEERVRPGWYSVIAAVAAGIVGMIALLQDRLDTLIGTVASVALVPAGAAAGIAWISGDATRALGGIVLLAINVALIVSMGMFVLLVAGRRAAPGEP